MCLHFSANPLKIPGMEKTHHISKVEQAPVKLVKLVDIRKSDVAVKKALPVTVTTPKGSFTYDEPYYPMYTSYVEELWNRGWNESAISEELQAVFLCTEYEALESIKMFYNEGM